MAEAQVRALEQEVKELEGRVMKMRSQGPASFKSLLQSHLHKLRPSVEQQESPASCVPAFSGEIDSLQARFAAAADSLPALLERINRCTAELDNRLALLKLRRSQDLFEQPEQEEENTPVDDLINGFLTESPPC